MFNVDDFVLLNFIKINGSIYFYIDSELSTKLFGEEEEKEKVELNFTVWIKLCSKQWWHSLNIIQNECKLRKGEKDFWYSKKTHSIDEYLLPIIYHFIWQIIVWINFIFHSIRCQTAVYHLLKYRRIIIIVSHSSLSPSFKWLFSLTQFNSVNKNVWLQRKKTLNNIWEDGKLSAALNNLIK